MSANLLYLDGTVLTQANAAAIGEIAEFVLEIMASGSYAGQLLLGNSNPIGVFTDTVLQGNVDSSDVTILSNTYTISQSNVVTSTIDPPDYLGLVIDGNQVILQENATSTDVLADEILNVMVNGGSNSYYLANAAPSDGGTWVSIGTLVDTLQNFTIISETYQLWHKISNNVSFNKVPIKLNYSNVDVELISFSSTELEYLIKNVEERFQITGVGQYVLSENSPETGGVWVSAGTITDVRRTFASTNYTGTTNYLGPGPASYQGPDAAYVGTLTAVFQGPPSNDVTYTGTGPNSYGNLPNYIGPPGTYTGPAINFTGPGPFPYVGSVLTPYAGSGPPQNFFGPAFFSGTAPNTTNFTGPIDYGGDIVSANTEIVSTLTLWKRIY